MARSINLLSRTTRARRFAPIALASTALMTPAAAWADCTPATGTAVTCSGTSAAYTNTASGVNVTVNSDASVVSPLVIGTSGTLTNAGTITNTGAVYGVQYGDSAKITNNGTITSTSSSSGAGAISVGNNATVTNNGVLTAVSGTPAVSFGTNGTFVNTTTATAAVTGNIVFGTNTGTNNATFTNNNVTYGFTGVVTASGNITGYNNGTFTGTFSQSAVSATSGIPNAVSFTNDFGGTFTGIFSSGDTTTLTNAGTMYLTAGSAVGYFNTTGGTSTLINNNTVKNTDGTITNSQLWIGTATAPAKVTVYGNYVQGANGTLNIPIYPAGSAVTAAGTTYSQLFTTGTATLNGTLNLNVTAGFYPTGTVFSVIHANGGITGDFANFTVNSGTNLLFTTFTKLGAVNSASGTDYQFTATHNSYDTVMAANGANANQIAISKALGHTDGTVAGTTGLLATATNNTGSDAATLLGMVDILGASDAKVFLDQISPEGYLAYATALRDQANLFHRTIDLRMKDQNSDHPEDGWWLTPMAQGSFSSTASTVGGYRTRDQITAIAAGYDFSGPNHVYGAAFNLSWDKLHYAPANLTGTNRDYAVAAYVGKNFGPLHLTGIASYHMGKVTATKIITIGTNSLTANASVGEDLFKATGKAGFELKAGGYTLEPFVGIDFNKGKIKGFTETGAGAANLTVNSISADRTELLAGVSLTSSKGMWRPYVTATYRSKLTGAGNTVTAMINGQSDAQFTVTGLAQANSQVDANAGVNIMFDDAGALFIGYQGTYRSNYMAHGLNLGIRLEF